MGQDVSYEAIGQTIALQLEGNPAARAPLSITSDGELFPRCDMLPALTQVEKGEGDPPRVLWVVLAVTGFHGDGPHFFVWAAEGIQPPTPEELGYSRFQSIDSLTIGAF